MKPENVSREKSHFDRLYAASDDPWHFRSSAYERGKYAATIAALTRAHFADALEVGCSIGELTALLAPRCGTLLGIDIAAAPLQTARARCAGMRHVAFQQLAAPLQWPQGRFDLIVLSEVLYFLSAADVRGIADRVRDSLQPHGAVLLVNWLETGDDPGTGDTAAEAFIAAVAPALHVTMQQREAKYRIDRLATLP